MEVPSFSPLTQSAFPANQTALATALEASAASTATENNDGDSDNNCEQNNVDDNKSVNAAPNSSTATGSPDNDNAKADAVTSAMMARLAQNSMSNTGMYKAINAQVCDYNQKW